MEKLLEKFNMKPNPSDLEAARVLLEKDYSLAIERLETSPLSRDLPKVLNVDYYIGDTVVVSV